LATKQPHHPVTAVSVDAARAAIVSINHCSIDAIDVYGKGAYSSSVRI
jgi:hypothetical protein